MIAMTLEMENQTKTEYLLERFQLNKIDKKQFLKNLDLKQDLIENFLSVAKFKQPSTNKCKQALNKCTDMISAYIYISLELTTPWSKNLRQRDPW